MRLQSWRSLLWTSRRVRRLALSAELDVWHVLNHERVQALQPDSNAVAVVRARRGIEASSSLSSTRKARYRGIFFSQLVHINDDQ